MSDEFEETERSRILSIVREEFQFPVVGEVQAVYPHTGEESRPSNHEVDVGVPPGPNAETTYRRVPVGVPTSGFVATPRAGDLVVLVFRRGEGAKPIVTQVVYGDADTDRAPEGEADVIRAKRENVYTELGPGGEWARHAYRTDGVQDGDGDDGIPKLDVGIDDSGPAPVAYLRADPNEDGTATASVELDDTGAITIRTAENQDIAVEHSGQGNIVTDHAGTGDVSIRVSGDGSLSIENTSPGGVTIENSNLGSITVSNTAPGSVTVEAIDGSVTVAAPSGDVQVDGTSVTLGGGGTGVITDATAETTTDSDGDVQSVTIDLTRSSVVSTE